MSGRKSSFSSSSKSLRAIMERTITSVSLLKPAVKFTRPIAAPAKPFLWDTSPPASPVAQRSAQLARPFGRGNRHLPGIACDLRSERH